MLSLELWWSRCVRDNFSGVLGRFFQFIAFVCAVCLSLILSVKHFLYDKGFFKSRSYRIPVISVGSIMIGGAGKTPFILFLLTKLSSKVAVIARGYHSKGSSFQVVCNGQGPLCSYEKAGDELYLIAKKHPQSIVIKSKNRDLGIQYAEKLGAQLILLDDAMQNRKVQKNFEIALVPSVKKILESKLFPLGIRRDLCSRLFRADLVIETQGGKLDTEKLAQRASLRYNFLKVQFESGEELKALENRRVGVFCAIADPYRFKEQLEALGAVVVKFWFFPDHREIEKKQLQKIAQEAENLDMILCTEKDEVKLTQEKRSLFDPQKLGIVHCGFEANESLNPWIKKLQIYCKE